MTASYISPAMHALHDRAAGADVLLLNEIGLDPGIDHCSAHAMLERIRGSGGSVRSFVSFCGGLPAPEAAEGVPLGYKFSWSPRGVLRAANEGAHFLLNGKEISIPGEKILAHRFTDVPVSDVLRFEGLANRDSMPYLKTYQLPGPQDGLHTMLRGTLRYVFCAGSRQSSELTSVQVTPDLPSSCSLSRISASLNPSTRLWSMIGPLLPKRRYR